MVIIGYAQFTPTIKTLRLHAGLLETPRNSLPSLRGEESSLSPRVAQCRWLNALIFIVRPLQLHRVTRDLLEVPCTDVADLAVGVIIPTGPRDRISYRLAKFMRAGCRHGIKKLQSSKAASTSRIRHYGIIDVARTAVVAAVTLTRAAAPP
jgi:hypothetical protein